MDDAPIVYSRRDPGGRPGETYIGALDIGGTKILAGIIDPSGKLMARRSVATLAECGAEDVVARCVSLMQNLAQEAHIAIEMLVPGHTQIIEQRTVV